MPVAAEPGRAEQQRLVAALRRPGALGDDGGPATVLETHISYVLLTGRHAWKIKKAVDLGFLDFTTLAARRRYCDEELRLNRRLAPLLYLDVVPIGGTFDAPAPGGGGDAIEYAVRMREFAQDALLSRVLARSELTAAHVDALAAQVAAFHGGAAVAAAESAYGAPDDILDFARQNFDQIDPLLSDPADHAVVAALRAWTDREFEACLPRFRSRRADGFVRECHGDLHLGNMALIDGAVTIFDCLEFNDRMRWGDVMSEVAFLVMDLHDRGRPDFAHRFLNAYLEHTGDYAGLGVLRFYDVYRAMVRAKVACFRLAQLAAGADKSALQHEFRGYLDLASRHARTARGAVVITHGLAGCGKSTLTEALLEIAGAVRVRTDVERKRLHGLPATARTGAAIGGGLYAADATERTYLRVRDLARLIAGANRIAVVDGTFLRRRQRDLFRELAAELAAPLAIVAFAAGEATLRARIARRARDGHDASDADLAVLDHQLAMREPLAADEQAVAIGYDAEAPVDCARRPASWRRLLERIGIADATPLVPPPLPDPGLEAKVAFLSQPHVYPEPASRVDRVETHMSWVFLTDRHAWKLKKPVAYSYLDFGTERARRIHCAEEVRLNRRLAPHVYLGIVPMTLDGGGRLQLTPDGTVVDWLVKMRRLPAARMLDRLIRERTIHGADLRHVVGTLARFYRDARVVTLTPAAYRARLSEGIAANRCELALPEYGLPPALVEAACARQRALLDQAADLFDRRVEAGRIVEGHGDLRPEHICVGHEIEIIDCLEFAPDLRTADVADELAFLALECERLGAPALRAVIFDAWRDATGDAPPDELVHFYQSYRACVRAKIALWHLREPLLRDQPRWLAQARTYLDLALEHGERCG
jgi:hypothetical protein